ncbi:hypothetical protein ACNQQN_24790 [Mycobacteroides chelonae]|uniref:hypothetical protein n=1 Tax=Mycobacteroides chelonae TaxID=1774 RepID=UPI003AABED66
MAANAGGTPLIEDGVTFVAASQTAKDLQYIESRKLTDEEVAVVLIPPPMIGICRSCDVLEYRRAAPDVVSGHPRPMAETMIQDEIVLQLLPDFESKPEKFYVEFNLIENSAATSRSATPQSLNPSAGHGEPSERGPSLRTCHPSKRR